MVKQKTGRLNYYKLLLNNFYTPGNYQPYLRVEYLTTPQINEYLNKRKPESPKKEFEIIYQRITKVYLCIIYIKRLTKPIRLIYKKAVPEIITLD
jgi:hypothetical protein